MTQLHPQALPFVAGRKAFSPPNGLNEIQKIRSDAAAFKRPPFPEELGESRAQVSHFKVLCSDGAQINVRLYRPHGVSEEDVLPALIYMHGGGFYLGGLDNVDTVCRFLSNSALCVIVSVEYRKAPEHRFPRPMLDVVDAIIWTFVHAPDFNIDPNRVAIGGESAGANLALGAMFSILVKLERSWRLAAEFEEGAQTLPSDELLNSINIPVPIHFVFQLLVYPVTNCSFDSDSYLTFAQGFGITRQELIWCWEQYAPAPLCSDWRASILLTPKEILSLAPPALIATAGCDVLRDDGSQLAQLLREAGVQVTYRLYEGMPHGFYKQVHQMDTAKLALKETATSLRLALHVKRLDS